MDGCYWHGCPAHHRQPTLNSEYWSAKIRRNRDRDLATDQLLIAAGWKVIRIWEHEDPVSAATRVAAAVRATH
jgi:DNA mismatch endonuclease (patch repair protein)